MLQDFGVVDRVIRVSAGSARVGGRIATRAVAAFDEFYRGPTA